MGREERRTLTIRVLLGLIVVVGVIWAIQERDELLRILGSIVAFAVVGAVLMLRWTAKLRFWELMGLVRRNRDRRD